eukprot:1969744-Amphidinium_carterae.3
MVVFALFMVLDGIGALTFRRYAHPPRALPSRDSASYIGTGGSGFVFTPEQVHADAFLRNRTNR